MVKHFIFCSFSFWWLHITYFCSGVRDLSKPYRMNIRYDTLIFNYTKVKFRQDKWKFRANILSDYIKSQTFDPFRGFKEYNQLLTSCTVCSLKYCKTARVRSIFLPTLTAKNARSGSKKYESCLKLPSLAGSENPIESHLIRL